MDFSAFDTKKIDEYTAQAKASWGETSEYHEFERKSQARSKHAADAIRIDNDSEEAYTEYRTRMLIEGGKG